MKHILIYENYKTRQEKIELSKKFKNFIPGSFIIYVDNFVEWKIDGVYKFEVLVLCKIQRIKHKLLLKNEKPFKVYYVEFEIIDSISEWNGSAFRPINNKKSFEVGEKLARDIDDWKYPILYKSNSLKDAQNKYNELIEQPPYSEWILNKDTEKYNL